MLSKIFNYVFSKKTAANTAADKLTMRERLAALKNLPLFFKLVWQTSKPLAFLDGFLRLLQSVLPLAVLYIGKLIIDQVVMLTRAGNQHLSHTHLWQLNFLKQI